MKSQSSFQKEVFSLVLTPKNNLVTIISKNELLEMEEAIKQGTSGTVLLDLIETTRCDSRGLSHMNKLKLLCKEHGLQFAIAVHKEYIVQIFTLMGINKHITIYDLTH